MSQYPTQPQPQPQWQQGQWQPPPPPPGPPPGPKAGVWIAVAGGVLVLLLGVFGVTAFAAPGFLVDDDSDDSSSESSDEPRSREVDEGGPGGQPRCAIPPPNASAPEGEVSPPSEPDEPDAPDAPEAAPAGDAEAFATEYLGLVAAGDAAGVDERMCGSDEEWQYEDAVGEGRQLTLSEPRADATAPGGILADLTGPEGTVDGRITVLPDAGGWCVDTFYVF